MMQHVQITACRTWTDELGTEHDRTGKEWICVGDDDLLISHVHVAAMDPAPATAS